MFRPHCAALLLLCLPHIVLLQFAVQRGLPDSQDARDRQLVAGSFVQRLQYRPAFQFFQRQNFVTIRCPSTTSRFIGSTVAGTAASSIIGTKTWLSGRIISPAPTVPFQETRHVAGKSG
jgi:hypothetical protein